MDVPPNFITSVFGIVFSFKALNHQGHKVHKVWIRGTINRLSAFVTVVSFVVVNITANKNAPRVREALCVLR
jgi:hypothetical protein